MLPKKIMYMKRPLLIPLTILILSSTLLLSLQSSCSSESAEATISEPIPALPNYNDTTQWYITDRAAQADIFYIISTETGDYTLSNGHTCHYADTYSDSLRGPLLGEMKGVDRLLSGQLNFYSPYYRQCSLQSFVSDSLTKSRLLLPLEDIRRAFRYYLDKLNHDRPFILAGYSQGAMLLLDLLREMDETTFSRLIAAYVIGAVIPDSLLGPHIIPVRAADDTGVTICYNSVRTDDCAFPGWEYSSIGINPVNWQTDTTSAQLITEPSPSIPLDQQKRDTLTIRLNPQSRLLNIDGFTATDYILPLIGKEGNYHSREIWLYREQLRENMTLRAQRKLHINQ